MAETIYVGNAAADAAFDRRSLGAAGIQVAVIRD
jgi:hypothetical protein